MFVVGGTYKNRLGRYTVLGVSGNTLSVRYEDGTIAQLGADIQRKILGNMPKESDVLPMTAEITQRRRGVPSGPALDWSQYDLWNRVIFDHCFGERARDRLAYIDIDDDELSRLGSDDGHTELNLPDYIRTVERTLDLRKGRLLDWHFRRLPEWRRSGASSPPPYIAVLALFCVAAQRMHNDTKFSSANYYDRLAQILIGRGYSQNQRIALTDGFNRAHELWEDLEMWLRNQDGRYGLPSAQPTYGKAHVGYPISQALLRSTDRQKLVEFFSGEGFEPKHEVPVADMHRLMAPWVPRSSLSQVAKTNWKNQAASRKMAEIASLELSTWDGILPAQDGAKQLDLTSPIGIEARVVAGPRPKIAWGIVFRMSLGSSNVTYEVAEGGPGLPIEGEYAQSIEVVRGLREQVSEPREDVSIADFLVTPITMVEKGGTAKAVWQPRKVHVLTMDEELRVFRTRQHLEFGRRGMVLAYESIADKVGSLLLKAGALGMSQAPTSLGVPQDWVVFIDVKVTRLPDIEDDPELDALIPDIWSSVVWDGGLLLPGRKQWLLSRLPTVRIESIDDTNGLRAEVFLKSAIDIDREFTNPPPFEAAGNSLELDLAALALVDGVYGLTVTAYRHETDKAGHVVASHTFEVRSLDSPLVGGSESLSHRSDSPLWTISASPAGSDMLDEATISIMGACVQPELELQASDVTLPHDLAPLKSGDQEDILGSEQGVHRTLSGIVNCFNGAHFFMLSAVNTLSAYYRPSTGECKHCGLRKSYPRPGLSKLRSQASTRHQPAHQVSNSVPDTVARVASVPVAQSSDHEGLFEACMTLGGGSWSQMALLCRQASNEPVFSYEAPQLLSALGHIDIELDSTGLRPMHWKSSPPALVITAEEEAFLAGNCSPRLLKILQEEVQGKGGIYTAVPSMDGPSSHRIAGLDRQFIESIVESVNRQAGVGLAISVRPDRSIAGALAPLQAILSNARIVLGPPLADRFDVGTASWLTRAFTDSDGLYRMDSTPRQYLLRANNIWYQVSYRAGKHLAAMFVGKSLMAYDVQNQRLECPLGAQLPGLYERAVVLSSGLPPRIARRESKVLYEQVPKDVAAAVWTAVYSNG